MLNPPRKLPYLAPTILWLIGFSVLMSFDARGKLSWAMGTVSVAYLFLLPAYLLASLFYNFFVRPAKHRRWKEKFVCLRCGTMSVP
jgi:predicted membrane channel-forming protein YqfA (hemolysin III family)